MNKDLHNLKNLLFHHTFPNNFSLFFRENNEWNTCLSSIQYVPYQYSSLNLDFALEVVKSKCKIVEDFSIIIKNNKKTISVMPLFVYKEKESYSLGLIDQNILPPIFSEGVSEKLKKQTIDVLIFFVETIKNKLNIKSLKFIDSIVPNSEISIWHKTLVENNNNCQIKREAFVDLSLKINVIKSLIRKSYKSLITKGEKLWNINAGFSVSDEIWNEFIGLHFKAAGGKTRSDISWELLRKGLDTKNAFFIYCSNKREKMIGGAFFFLTHSEAYYGVAAYNRDLFDYPIGHVIQFRAILEFKKMNLLWYRLGSIPMNIDNPQPSVKEVNIGKFKNGFSTHTFPQFFIS